MYRNRKRESRFRSYAIQSEILKSGFTVLQTRKALSKAWLGYTIAKDKGENENIKYYASVIHKLQKELLNAWIIGQESLAQFPNIDTDEAITKQKPTRKSPNIDNHNGTG
jgi:hypothetical protein